MLAAVIAAAYHNSFDGPLVLDDGAAILDNESIRTLWPLSIPLSPPTRGGVTVAGRPLLNLSLALNYAISGFEVWSYHLLNLLIHLAASLTLFGIVRRTLLQPALRERFAPRSTGLAAAAALLWAVHPLQTESVTYVIQRAESLCGLLYLLTLYAFLRGTSGAGSRAWLLGSVAACLLAVATKEVAATAPLIVLLYDATFLAGSLRRALRRRWRYYACLSSAWLLLAWLMSGSAGRGGTAGFASGIPWWSYALTQSRAVVRYLWLSVWPRDLVFDYGNSAVVDPTSVTYELIALLALVGAVLYALRAYPAAGFLGAWLLVILAPTSSVVPISTQTIAEHRMYLPLAAIAVGVAAGAHLCLRRWMVGGAAAAALVLAFLTWSRNDTYRSAIGLWSDTVAKVPASSRAHNGLGLALTEAGRPREALEPLGEAIRLDPGSVEYNNNFALALSDVGMLPEALALIEDVSRSAPRMAAVADTRAQILAKMGRTAEATATYEEALRLDPQLVDSHRGLGRIFVEQGRLQEAANHYSAVIEARPGDADAQRQLRAIERRLEGIAPLT